MKNRTIVLRSAGSGALLGLGAGLVSYPFAKSGKTVAAGAIVGALLGTVYGFYLVNRRDESFQNAGGLPSGGRPDRPGLTGVEEFDCAGATPYGANGGQTAAFQLPVITFDLR
ncbi:MAG: hypothetical protein H7301_10620 [Cryobacterium sp.]|nr:hypothetical protein [Oligoflexia bacterium]